MYTCRLYRCGSGTTGDLNDEKEPLIIDKEGWIFDENRPSELLPVERRQSFVENRTESFAEVEERQLSADSNGQSSVNETIGETGQNEQLPDEKVQTPKKGQSDTIETREKSLSSAEKGRQFRDEFKTAVEEVRSKIASKIFYPNTSGNLNVHVLFTYTHTNGLKTAAVVDLRNTKSLNGNHPTMGRLRSSRKTLLIGGGTGGARGAMAPPLFQG